MTITQLRYFQKACKLDNITRAAEALHVSQPSVSAAIRELEEEFGFALLERRGRSFSLTPNGAVFLAEADRLLSHVSDFETAMVRLAQGPGQLKVGVPPMIGSLVLPLIYTGEEHRRTPFDLGIVEAGRQELLQRLSAGELDLAFIPHDRPLSASYTGIAVTILETVCCTSLFHPLAGQERLAVAQLADEPLALFKNSFFQTERIIARFEVEHITPHVLLQSDQLSTIRKLIASNAAVGFLFSKVACSLPELAAIPLDPPMTTQVSLVWRVSDCLSDEHRRFINYVGSLTL